MAKSILRAGKIAGIVIVAIIVVAVALYSVGVLSIAQTDYPPPETVGSPESAPAEPAEALLAQCESSYTQANDYWQLEKYDEAKALYQYISQNSTDSSLAFKAKAGIAGCQIRMGHESAAELAIETLMNDYSQRPELCENIYGLAESYRIWLEHDKAKAIYQYISLNSTDSSLAFKAKAGVAGCQIRLGNESTAELAIEKFKKDYSQHPELCENIYGLAEIYRICRKNDKAKAIYQYISQNSTESNLAFKAKADVADCQIRMGNESAAEMAIETLMDEYSQHPELCENIYGLAETYRNWQKNDKAKDIYQYISQNSLDSNLTFKAKAGVAGCQIRLGNESAAELAIETLMNDYSQHPELCTNICGLAETYRNWQKHDKAKDIYQYISLNSTDSNLAIKATAGVAGCQIQLGNDSAADQVIETLKNDYAQHPKLFASINSLANNYKRQRKYDKSRDLYQYIAQNCSDSNLAIKAQTQVAVCQISLGNGSAAGLAIETLKNEYTQHPELCKNVYELAETCRKWQKHDKAKDIDQYISENYPNSNQALKIRTQAVIRKIRSGDYTAAEEAFETLYADFSSAEGFVDTVLAICNVFIQKNNPAMALPYINDALQDSPGYEKAVLLLNTKAECYASMGNTEMVDAVIEEIAQIDLTPGTLNKTADKYREQGYYAKSIELYQQALDSDKDENQQLLAYAGTAMSYFRSGDEPAARQTLDELTVRFADNPKLSRQLYEVGENCRKGKNYPAARNLYDYIATEFPQTYDAMWSDLQQIVIDIDQAEDPNDPAPNIPPTILAKVDNLIADFESQPGLTKAVFFLGEKYYRNGHKGNFGPIKKDAKRYWPRAIKVWEKVIDATVPFHDNYTPEAWFLTGICYSRMRDPSAALPYLEKVVTDWQKYKYAWNAQIYVGVCYGQLKRANRHKPNPEYDQAIEEAYTDVLEKYGDCTAVFYANMQLADLKYKQQRWQESAMHAEQYLADKWVAHSAQRAPVLYKLGQCYENMGEPDSAQAIYQQYMTEFGDTNLSSQSKVLTRLAVLEGGAK